MITTLAVKNYVLIDELTIEFSDGLNVFTGETGAGKSIIVDAAGFLVGEKMPSSVVRDGAQSCTITGIFTLPAASEAVRLLLERGYTHETNSSDEEVVVRRELDSSGRTRCYINDKPSTVAFLKELGGRLIDIHGQHEHQTLLDPAFQREFLDGYASSSRELKTYRVAHSRVADIASRLASLDLDIKEKARLTDLYEYQIKDIDSAQLAVGDEERIAEILPQMKNAGRLKEAAATIKGIIDSNEGSISSSLSRLSRELTKSAELGAPFASDLTSVETMSSALAGINESVTDFLDKAASFDENKVDELISKLDKIDRLKKKYGATIEEILAFRRVASERLNALKTGEETKADLENELAVETNKLKTAAAALSKKRKAAAGHLVGKVASELNDLGLVKAEFSIFVERDEISPAQWTPYGADRIEFMFSANAGERLRPLKDIISGGEMSRFMLALKTVGAGSPGFSPIMIFDEIDAGLGGPSGQIVGAKLRALSLCGQTIAITHLAQIAAFAARHFFVEKSESAGRTVTRVRRLSAEEIRSEIARMLSGRKVTDTALRHADELIRQAKSVAPPK